MGDLPYAAFVGSKLLRDIAGSAAGARPVPP
jgi:hypothetical protein